MIPSGALQPPDHLQNAQQAAMKADAGASLFWLSDKEELFYYPKAYLQRSPSPWEVSQLYKYGSKLVQPFSFAIFRETFFLEVMQFNLQMNAVLSPSWEEAANCSRSMNRVFCKVDYCPWGKWKTFPSSPSPAIACRIAASETNALCCSSYLQGF